MKQFLNPKELQIKVQDIEKQDHIWTLLDLTTETMDKMSELQKDLNNCPGEAIRKQLSLMFGEDESYYKKFDSRVLTEVFRYITDEIKNPTQAVQRN